MRQSRFLMVGGLVALGFDTSSRFLLVISHAGRGVYATGTWERVARDATVIYPNGDRVRGIGPIAGQDIAVVARDDAHERIELRSPDGQFFVIGEADGVTIT